MVRPKGHVLFKHHADTSSTEVMLADAVWIVMYQGSAISVARTTWTSRGQVIKYMRTNYSNPAHAYRLAAKLNKMFDTEDFTVREINI